MNIVLFEDDGARRLHPATLARAAFAISCGSYRLWDLVAELGHPVQVRVRPHLRAVVEADFQASTSAASSKPSQTLLVNARLVPSATVRETLRGLIASGKPGMVRVDQQVAAALLPADADGSPEGASGQALDKYLAGLQLDALDAKLPLLEYPHDIIRYHLAILGENLADRLARGDYRQLADGVFVADGAQLGEHVVTDTREGPIVLEAGAQIGPYSYLCGPAHLGEGCRVIEHSAIKDFVSLGHTTKIGGEVEASIIEPYTNKQHHGFLGHSYLGSWINLGAGTCNSDLKNTYGNVRVQYGTEKIDTGMQFVGCVMGDYAKTAINTGIFTGKVIGACSMVYGFVTTNVPRFVNYARLFGQVTETPVEVMLATQKRMFARRDVTQRPCDIELMHAMYELTRDERQMAGEPLSL